MLADERKAYLLGVLDRERRVVAKSVSAELQVSEDTIRRDLRELAEAGLCVRVYGGALPIPEVERPVSQRAGVASDSKDRVARAAVDLVDPGSTIALDGGTTAVSLARMLPPGAGLTVITPSPAVALALAEHTDARVLMIGGELSAHSLVNGGALAIEAIQRLSADVFFLGAAGIHPEHGLTTGELDDAVTKRALAARSSRVFVLASEDKIGATSRYPIVGFDEVEGIVVDPRDDNPVIDRLPAVRR